MYVDTRGIEQGYRATILSSLGLALGDLPPVILTVVKLSAVLALSTWLFVIVKCLGAPYLIGLGLHRLLSDNQTSPTNSVVAECSPRLVSSGSLIEQAFFAHNRKTVILSGPVYAVCCRARRTRVAPDSSSITQLFTLRWSLRPRS